MRLLTPLDVTFYQLYLLTHVSKRSENIFLWTFSKVLVLWKIGVESIGKVIEISLNFVSSINIS
jgi:hypothetical protein